MGVAFFKELVRVNSRRAKHALCTLRDIWLPQRQCFLLVARQVLKEKVKHALSLNQVLDVLLLCLHLGILPVGVLRNEAENLEEYLDDLHEYYLGVCNKLNASFDDGNLHVSVLVSHQILQVLTGGLEYGLRVPWLREHGDLPESIRGCLASGSPHEAVFAQVVYKIDISHCDYGWADALDLFDEAIDDLILHVLCAVANHLENLYLSSLVGLACLPKDVDVLLSQLSLEGVDLEQVFGALHHLEVEVLAREDPLKHPESLQVGHHLF